MALAGARIAGKSDYAYLTLGRAYGAAESHGLAVDRQDKRGVCIIWLACSRLIASDKWPI
jgi:hypothetical protein